MLQAGQQVAAERRGVPCATAMAHLAGGEMQGASQIGLRVLAGWQDLQRGAFGPPGRADLRPQVDVERIGQDQHRMGVPRLGLQPPAGQACDPLGSILRGHPLRSCPDPMHVVAPASHGPSRHLEPMWHLQCHGQRGTAPARATPALGARRRLAPRPQGPLPPRPSDRRPDRRRQLAVWGDGEAHMSRLGEPDTAVDTGT
jgi:hypothetical protein